MSGPSHSIGQKVAGAARRAIRSDSEVQRGKVVVLHPKNPKFKIASRIYLNGIPRTATAPDILQALKDRELVPPNFGLSNITPSAVSLPRVLSMHRQWHVDMQTNEAAMKVYNELRRTAFSYGVNINTLFPGFYTPPSLPLVDMTIDSPGSFHNRQRERIMDSMPRDDRGGSREDGWTGGDKWTVTDGTKFDGKGVVLVGMPPGAGWVEVRKLMSYRLCGNWTKRIDDLGLSSSQKNMFKLLPSGSRQVSWFGMRFETAAQAHRMVRLLNMTTYTPQSRLEESQRRSYLLRAEVV